MRALLVIAAVATGLAFSSLAAEPDEPPECGATALDASNVVEAAVAPVPQLAASAPGAPHRWNHAASTGREVAQGIFRPPI